MQSSGTAVNAEDVTQANALLHGQETLAYGDAGYQGANRRPNARDNVAWKIAMRPGKRKALPKTKLGQILDALEKAKAQLRAKVEHPFHVIKNLFVHRKSRYRGLAKNTAQLYSLFGLANLLAARLSNAIDSHAGSCPRTWCKRRPPCCSVI